MTEPVAVPIGDASLKGARPWAPASGLGAERTEVKAIAGGEGLGTPLAVIERIGERIGGCSVAPCARHCALHRVGPDRQQAFEVF